MVRGDRSDLSLRVRKAVIWRSGSQVLAQLIAWVSTFIVIRLLAPQDYGLFAMSQVVLVFLNLMNGHGFANALIQRAQLERSDVAQAFGVLILVNGALALAQLVSAPFVAAYFREPLVADMLRVQALLYVITPFIAIPNALLSRGLEFQRQALVNLLAAVAGAGAAWIGATSGWGVWTLVTAALVVFYTRGIGFTLAATGLAWPTFRLKGAGLMLRFGTAQLVTQLFWFLQSHSDVFIAGRILSAHDLGIYTTAFFLCEILVSKFVPPLNEVAFAAYSRMQDARDDIARGFTKTVQLIMLVALPFYFGLAVTAEPLVLTVIGEKWAATIPVIEIVALTMPFMTLQILYAPATNALGRPGIAMGIAALGAVVMPASFLIGAQYGVRGLAYAWLAGFPLLALVTSLVSLPVIGVRATCLVRTIFPLAVAAGGMALGVVALDSQLGSLAPLPRLCLLVPAGASLYALLLHLLAPQVIVDVRQLLIRRTPAAAS